MMANRIFISGAGIVSAIGNNKQEVLSSLLNQNTGIARLRYLKTSHTEFPVGEVKFTNEEMSQFLHITETQEMSRTSLMGMMAVQEALKQAKIQQKNGLRIAFISGTTVGGMDKRELCYDSSPENDTKNDYIEQFDCGRSTEIIADHFGIFSIVETISTACSSAANAIMKGAQLIQDGRADIVVAGGSECITKFHLNGFNSLMILDQSPCRPFDANRAGLNLGEGAAYLVLESEEVALRRNNTEPLSYLSGYANTCDAYHQTASSPNGDGAYLAMVKALETSGLKPDDIDYINAHGTGTANNDLSEGIAIQRVFAEKIPPVSSTKSFTGHTTSAAGSVEAVISLLALKHNFIPSNIHFTTQIEELAFSPYIEKQSLENSKNLRHVLSNSFGFGGNGTTLIFSK